MLRTKIVRPPEIKVLDAAKGRAQVALVSDESEDRDGDIIRASGWILDDFQRHPVLLSSHDYASLRAQIGEWEDMAVKGKRLQGTARYYVGEGNEEADWAFNLAAKGRAAYSVGFIPLTYSERTPGSWGGGLEFTKQELLEVSQVSVPSNPHALQLMAKSAGLHPEVDAIVKELLGEQEKAGRVMSQANLDRLHGAMESLAIVHEGTCDMAADCPVKGVVNAGLSPGAIALLVRHAIDSKQPIAPHSTATSEAAWDGPANVAALRNDETAPYYRKAFAWIDPDGSPDTKAAYKFIHHEVGSEGDIGAANFIACSAGIAVLNGGRGGADIPDSDRQGVWNHLARHLRDGDREPPELRSLDFARLLELAAR